MRTLPASLALAAGAALILGSAPVAQAQVLDPIQYQLDPGSLLEYGCFGPCACPVVFSGALQGTFTFYRTDVGPVYTTYSLLNINWTYSIAGAPSAALVHVTGHGTYQYGGEFALMQRMTLSLSFDGGPEQLFDSGLVPPVLSFPSISIDVHSSPAACKDTLIRVLAGPPGTASIAGYAPPPLLRLAHANPSGGEIELEFAPAATGAARVEVFDVRGRLVATLLDDVLDAGRYGLRWNGRNLAGQDAGAGVFWIRARAGLQTDRLRVVRLK